MRPKRRLLREWPVALVAVLFGAALIGLWHPGDRGSFWPGIEGRLLDARFLLRGPRPAPDSVAIVAFDDATMAALDRFPPPRATLGAVVAAAWDAGAQTVVPDFLLVDPRPDDAELAAAMAQGASVLAVAEASAGSPLPPLRDDGGFALLIGPAPSDPLPALAPVPALQDAATLAHATVLQEPDGALRRIRPLLAVGTTEGVAQLPGLAVAAVAAHAERGAPRLRLPASGRGGLLEIGAAAVVLDRHGAVPLNFLGPSGTIRTYPAHDLTAADLEGRIVFIGATAVGFGDRHATPFDQRLPGVEAQATLAANLLTGSQLRRDGAAWLRGAGLAVLAALAGFGAAGLRRPLLAGAATLAVVLASAAALQAAFLAGWWLDATSVAMALTLGAGAGSWLRRLDQHRRAINLARYQSPSLVEALATMSDPLRQHPPQHAAVLFVDVRAFTSHAEDLDPHDTTALLSVFHRLVEDAADPCGGIITHFAGDGVLLVFGLPDPRPDDTERALRFVEALYGALRTCPDWPGLGVRVGGHAGKVQAGVLGGARHRHLTVGGDVVNTANRLLEVARSCDQSLALSDALVASTPGTEAWAARAGLRPLAQQSLRGRAGPERVWVGAPP